MNIGNNLNFLWQRSWNIYMQYFLRALRWSSDTSVKFIFLLWLKHFQKMNNNKCHPTRRIKTLKKSVACNCASNIQTNIPLWICKKKNNLLEHSTSAQFYLAGHNLTYHTMTQTVIPS